MNPIPRRPALRQQALRWTLAGLASLGGLAVLSPLALAAEPAPKAAAAAQPAQAAKATKAAAAATAAKAAPAVEPASVTLDLTPLPNSRQQQDMEMRMTMAMAVAADNPGLSPEKRDAMNKAMNSPQVPRTMLTVMRQTLSVGGPDAQGRLPIEADVLTLKSEARNSQGELVPMPDQEAPVRFTAKLNNGRYEDVEMPGVTDEMLPREAREKMFEQIFDSLARMNGMTLKVGESAEVPLDLSLPLPTPVPAEAKISARYTLKSVKQGVAHFDIAMNMAVDMVLPAPAPSPASAASAGQTDTPPAASTGPTMAMLGDGTGTMQLRLADRVQLRNDLTMKLRMTMGLPDGNRLAMDMTMAMKTQGKALPVAKR